MKVYRLNFSMLFNKSVMKEGSSASQSDVIEGLFRGQISVASKWW